MAEGNVAGGQQEETYEILELALASAEAYRQKVCGDLNGVNDAALVTQQLCASCSQRRRGDKCPGKKAEKRTFYTTLKELTAPTPVKVATDVRLKPKSKTCES